MDPRVNGQLQKDWGWLVAIYLFLGGVGAGAYTIAAINGFFGKSAELSTVLGLSIGFPALLVGSLFLVADLGTPKNAVLAGMRPGSSWIARGFWIISVFMIIAFAHSALRLFTDYGSSDGGRAVLSAISVAGIVFAISTMAYTGILLGASKGIPFWRSGVVPVIFVISALVTGHFTIMVGMVILGEHGASPGELQIMAAEAAGLVVLEVLAILFFLQAAYRDPDTRESGERILRNRLFVVGYFVLGLGAPLLLMLVVLQAGTDGATGTILAAAAVGAVLGLAGGLILRQAVLICGALPTLNMAGFQFRRIARPKDPKPGVGLLPPA
jgi:formate-dependent nitrite reductase membrane component NrfD